MKLADVHLDLAWVRSLGVHHLTEVFLLGLQGEAEVVDSGQEDYGSADGNVDFVGL